MAVGKISFSLYMWHQLLLAYTRYFLVQELRAKHLIAIFILTVIFSVVSYFLIERPFRNKSKISTKTLLLILGLVFLFLTNASSFYVYYNAGVLKDIPELGISKSEAERNMHSKYNARIYDYDNNFRLTDKIKVLVIGASFARDWVNVLLESKYVNDLQISYIYNHDNHKELKARAEEADIIFISTLESHHVLKFGTQDIKLWAIGTKNFGTSNGVFYNYKGDDYYKQRTPMEKGYLEKNKIMLQDWGSRYIDLIGKVIDDNQTVPVFTPFHQFISNDCRHFTKAGAQYYAQLFEHELTSIFSKAKK